MRERARLFTIQLAHPDRGRIEADVWAETPQLACAAAEAEVTGARAVHFTMEADVLGRCDKCHSFIESGERHQRVRGVVRCSDCL